MGFPKKWLSQKNGFPKKIVIPIGISKNGFPHF